MILSCQNDHPGRLHELLSAPALSQQEGLISQWLGSTPVELAQLCCFTEDDKGDLPLHTFSRNGGWNLKLLRHLLGLNPGAAAKPNHAGMLPLHIALKNHLEGEQIDALCVANEAAIATLCSGTSAGDAGETTLEIAVNHYPASGRLEILQILLQRVNSRVGLIPAVLTLPRPKNLLRVLLEHSSYECDDCVGWLLESELGALLMTQDGLLLHAALKHSHSISTVLAILYKNPGCCCRPDEAGNFPVHLALAGAPHCRSLFVVQEILAVHAAGASTQDFGGRLPLHVCITNNTPTQDVVDLLLRCHPEAAAVMMDGVLPLHQAIMRNVSTDVLLSLITAYPKGLLVATGTLDGSFALHLAVLAGASTSTLSVLLRHCPDSAHLRDKMGRTTLDLALSIPSSPLSSLLMLLKYNPQTYSRKFIMRVCAEPQNAAAFIAMMDMVRPVGRQIMPVSIHLVGDSYSGKTTLRNGLSKTLGQLQLFSGSAGKRGSQVETHRLDRSMDERTRTIGMEREMIVSGGLFLQTRYLVHDYGGQREFHINHQQFLAGGTNPVYIVLAALWDINLHQAIADQEILRRYAGWVRFIFSLRHEAYPTIVTVLNFSSLAVKQDAEAVSRVSLLLEEYQTRHWPDINFFSSPIPVDVLQVSEVKSKINTTIYRMVQAYTEDWQKNQLSNCVVNITESLSGWPRLLHLDVFRADYLRPLLEKAVRAATMGPDNIADADLGCILEHLSDFAFQYLLTAGDIYVLKQFVVLDLNYITRTVLGRIFMPEDLAGWSSEISVFTIEQIREKTLCMHDDCTEAEALKSYTPLLPPLLEALGLCVPVESSELDGTPAPTSYCFPALVALPRGPFDCQRQRNATRIVHRRWKLGDNGLRQIFPPAFFSRLFCSICRLEHHTRRVRIFSNGLELNSNYVHLQSNDLVLKNKIQILVTYDDHGSSFDLTVCAGTQVSAQDGRVWQRLQEIRDIVSSSGVPLVEFCVHPGDMSSERELQQVLADVVASKEEESRQSSLDRKEELCSHLFGELNGGAAEEPSVLGANGEISRKIGNLIHVAVSEQLSSVQSELSKMKSLLKCLIVRKWDLPFLPLLVKAPLKSRLKEMLNVVKKSTHEQYRLFFVCPVCMQVGPSGPRGKGYKIQEPKTWVHKIYPVLQVSMILISIGLKLLGVPLSLPCPTSLSDLSLEANAFLVHSKQTLKDAKGQSDSAETRASEGGGTEDSDTEDSDTGNIRVGLREIFAEGVDPLAGIKETAKVQQDTSSGQISFIGDDQDAVELTDANFEALKSLLSACGDPLPNGRPLYSGLSGPIISDCDSSVAWVMPGQEDKFRKEGKQAFFRKS